MKSLPLILSFVILSFTAFAAEESPEDAKIRASIPLGGDFKPNPKVGAFVVVGHGARIIVSKDDGKTWKQAFFAAPGADHGPWATKSVAYTHGVFAVPVAWGGPTIYLASDDAVNWRHLTSGATKLPQSKDDPRLMTGFTWGLAGGKGAFVSSGYMTFSATADLGKTFTTFAIRGAFKDDPRGKLNTHHIGALYCGDASGRFLALGDNRGDSGPKFGNLFASDDLGKTWKWLAPKGLDASTGRGTLESNGSLLVMTDSLAANAWTSADAGETWTGPHATSTQRATLNVVGSEFWLSGKQSRASSDGKTWRVLPAAVPEGKVIASDKGTLISIHVQRTNIQRSTDGGKTWQEVHRYEPPDIKGGAQGLRAGAFGLVAP
jgi:photosystem II stability/assembly factor-like uncharacterized protein